ncbi:MAG: hypothetical protein ACE5H4_09890 [Candidatus Thorarchaeota archaeon]
MHKRNLPIAIIVIFLMTGVGNVEPIPSHKAGTPLLENRPFIAQDESGQYNVSSYYDFALATGGILASKLVVGVDGTVFHYGYPEWDLMGWAPALADYYWAIAGMARIFEITGNNTLSVFISRVANHMVTAFRDTIYPGYFVNTFHPVEAIAQSKRPGIQAYAYLALSIAESVNSSLDFTNEKQDAIRCLTDVLYDDVYGGLRFMAYRNGSVSNDVLDVYPNDGKRLDHLALGATALYEEGLLVGNSTMIAMANSSLSFMIEHMALYNNTEFQGFMIATDRIGLEPHVAILERPGRSVITDLNAMAIQALLKGYEVTGNMTYLEWAEDTHKAMLTNHWDRNNGGWYAESLDGELWAPIDFEDTERYKYSEIQFQMVVAEEMLYEVTGELFYIRLVIDTLDIVLANLWDKMNGGFVANGDEDSSVLTDDWKNHYTGVQSLGVLALERVWSYGLPIVSYVRVGPSNPRPQDSVSFLATALDSDGIDTVLVNYTLELGGVENSTMLELSPHPEVGGVYNKTISPLPDGSRVNFVVIANDTLGNVFIAGNYFFAVRADIWGPVILLRAVYPTDGVRAGDTVVIEFGTYEFPTHSSIISFQMFWKVNDGVYEPENMTLVDVDEQYLVWVANLGSAFKAGDVISFYCLAEDETGNLGQSGFFRLTILGPSILVDPWTAWQVIATIGLVAAPGVGYGVTRIRRQRAHATQRELKKEARKRARKKKPRRSRRSN